MSGMQNMLLGRAASISLPTTLTAVGSSAGTAQGTIRLNANGDIERIIVDGGTTTLGKWITDGGATGGLYEARFTIGVGALEIGTAAVFQQLNASRSWGRQSGVADLICTGTLEIRAVGSAAILASSAVTLEADGTP